jgi:hypothetical protein
MMVTLKKYEVYMLILKIPVSSYGGRNGEVRWLGFEPLHMASELTILSGLSLQEGTPFVLTYVAIIYMVV